MLHCLDLLLLFGQGSIQSYELWTFGDVRIPFETLTHVFGGVISGCGYSSNRLFSCPINVKGLEGDFDSEQSCLDHLEYALCRESQSSPHERNLNFPAIMHS